LEVAIATANYSFIMWIQLVKFMIGLCINMMGLIIIMMSVMLMANYFYNMEILGFAVALDLDNNKIYIFKRWCLATIVVTSAGWI
jgi:hypothetical protein